MVTFSVCASSPKAPESVICENCDKLKTAVDSLEEKHSKVEKNVDSLNGKFISDKYITIETMEKVQKFYSDSFSNLMILITIVLAAIGLIIGFPSLWNWRESKKYNEEIKKQVEAQEKKLEEITGALENQKNEFKKIAEAFENQKNEKIIINQKGKVFKETQVQKSIEEAFEDMINTINKKTEHNINTLKTRKQVKEMPNFTDPRDGNIYRIAKIGNQTWMAENLRFKFNMPEMMYNLVNNEIYYNWKAAQKASPSGWHLPSIEDWEQLVNYCGGIEIAGEKLKDKNYVGTDEFNFSASMCGYYINKMGFNFIGTRAIWWTSTEFSPQKSYIQCIDGKKCYKYEELKENMFSIRCVKNES